MCYSRRRRLRRWQRWMNVLIWAWFIYCVIIFLVFASTPPR